MKEKCANCEHLGRDCPKQMLYLTLDNLIDWCRSVMTMLHITHDDVAKTSKVPKGTIDRVISKQSADCKYTTIHAIVCDLLTRLGVDAPCVDDLRVADSAQTGELKAQNAELLQKLRDVEHENRLLRERVTDSETQRTFLRGQVATKDTQIGMLSRTIRGWRIVALVLGGLVFLLLAFIIALLIYDNLNPEVGFFWRQ